MQIQENVSLAKYSTMRLGGNAKYLCEVTNEKELEEALVFTDEHKLRIHVVGGGSNTIFSDKEFNGLVIVNKIMSIAQTPTSEGIELSVGAGEDWDSLVAHTVELGFNDIAALSKIPGTVGAAPVQNIGAYGQQVSDSIVSVRAYDLSKKAVVDILRSSCNFSYRHSRFNQEDKNKFIITRVNLRMSRKKVHPPFYADVEHYFTMQSIAIDSVTAKDLRAAVTEIRGAKLPDPSVVANCGSFFGNPIISEETLRQLMSEHPNLRVHNTDDGQLKLYAGQLIELAGMKNYHDKETGMATWKTQSLVLINESANTTKDLLMFKQKIVANVQAAFGITLIQEPEFIE